MREKLQCENEKSHLGLVLLTAYLAECGVYLTKLNHNDPNSPRLALLYNSYGDYKNGPAYLWHNTDIQYCDSDHAITDMIKFIEYQNLNLPKDIKWVAVGCSYAGRLAVKIRGLYPDLIYATWASSALLYEKPLIPDFFPAVVDNIRKTCGDYLADTANYIIQVAYSGAQSCVYNPEYVKLVSNMIRNAEYKYKIPSYNTSTLETACGAVMHSNNFCGQNVKPKGIMSSTDYYVWKYQECHELGYLQQIQLNGCHQFSIPWTLNELTQSCKQENDLMTEILSKRSRILLVYGIDDPWIIASPPRDYPQIKRIDIPGGSHCSDWAAPSDDVEVNKYRNEIGETILSWFTE
ncbi:hypothetical protein C0J52_14047 [Blattella germanica]|nr:hypothetical protein C0J52_14047 [Blattella germanica]